MTKPKTTMKIKRFAVAVGLVAFAGAASAQTAAGSAAAPPPVTQPAAPAAPPAVVPAGATDARAACTAAMNADPKFAEAIVKIADERAAQKRDDDLLAAHTAADTRIKSNEKHVIYAYAALWIIAAGFVIFLWRRQQALTAEIAGLRRDLEAAADDAKSAPVRT